MAKTLMKHLQFGSSFAKICAVFETLSSLQAKSSSDPDREAHGGWWEAAVEEELRGGEQVRLLFYFIYYIYFFICLKMHPMDFGPSL